MGHYEIVKEIGHGGFATVYEVLDKDTGQRYAMKEYNLVESFECYQKEAKVGEYFFQNHQEENNVPRSIVKYI